MLNDDWPYWMDAWVSDPSANTTRVDNTESMLYICYLWGQLAYMEHRVVQWKLSKWGYQKNTKNNEEAYYTEYKIASKIAWAASLNPCCFLFYPGKTLLAKAVANQTSATFLRVCGSELIQKYLVRTMMFLSCCVIQTNKIYLVLQSLQEVKNFLRKTKRI